MNLKNLDLLLKEYNALCNESQNSRQNSNQILSFGLASIAIIFSGCINLFEKSGKSDLAQVFLIIAIPSIGIFLLFMLLGEYERMRRAGFHLSELEQKINSYFSSNILSWETNLIEQKKHILYPYLAKFGIIISLSVLAHILGEVFEQIKKDQYKYIIIVAEILFSLSIYYIIWRFLKVRKSKRKKIKAVASNQESHEEPVPATGSGKDSEPFVS